MAGPGAILVLGGLAGRICGVRRKLKTPNRIHPHASYHLIRRLAVRRTRLSHCNATGIALSSLCRNALGTSRRVGNTRKRVVFLTAGQVPSPPARRYPLRFPLEMNHGATNDRAGLRSLSQRNLTG